MAPVSHSGNDEVRTKALGSGGNVEDGLEVTYVKMRAKVWSPELSFQRRNINQSSPLPPLLKYA